MGDEGGEARGRMRGILNTSRVEVVLGGVGGWLLLIACSEDWNGGLCEYKLVNTLSINQGNLEGWL